MKNFRFHFLFTDLFKLSFSSLIVQVVSISTVPIITLYYSPESFGEFSLFLSIIGPVGVIAGWGLEPAITIAKTDREASLLFQLTIIITSVCSILLFSILIFFSIWYSSLSFYHILILPVIFFFGGLSNSLRYFNLRMQKINTLSLATVTAPISDRITTLSLAFAGYTKSSSLILGVIVDAIVRPLTLLTGVEDRVSLFSIKNFDIQKLRRVLHLNWKYPAFVLPTNLLLRLTGDIPIYFLSSLFSVTIVGYYAFGLRLLSLPLSLFSKAIADVSLQRASMLDDDGANKIFFTVFSKLISFTFLPFLYLTFVGDDLIVFFLGSKWETTGVFIRILAVGYFFRLVFSTNDYIFAYKNKQNYNLIMNVLLAAVTVISLFIGYYFESVEIALFLMTVSNSFVLFFFSLKLFIWCGFTAREFISLFLIEFKNLVVYLFLLLILKYILKVNFILLATYLVLSIIFRQRKYFLSFNTKR